MLTKVTLARRAWHSRLIKAHLGIIWNIKVYPGIQWHINAYLGRVWHFGVICQDILRRFKAYQSLSMHILHIKVCLHACILVVCILAGFALRHVCSLAGWHFSIFALCILAFWHVCILACLHWGMFTLRYICLPCLQMADFHFGPLPL